MAVTARDLMRTKVETLSPEDTVETALARFEEAGIGGAPVMADGRLVGMLTLTDVARTEHLEGGQPATLTEYAWGDSEELEDVDPEEVFYRKDNYSPEVLGRALVGDWMSRGVVSVPPDASLQRVCEVMVREQIHRVCVTLGDRLVGLVTSFDVVRHVAGARPARSSTRARRARHRGTGGSVGRE